MNFGRHNYKLTNHEFLGNCTFTATGIKAYPESRLSPIVPDRCSIFFERRFLPDETPERIENEFKELIAAAREKIEKFDASVEILKVFPSLYCPKEEPVAQALLKARERVLGGPGKISAWIFGTDGAFIAQRGIPCVGFGPGDKFFAHTPEEHIPIEHLEKAAMIMCSNPYERVGMNILSCSVATRNLDFKFCQQ